MALEPQDYSARTTYRPPAAWYRRANRLGVLLTSVGLAPRGAVTLEVRGRRSGKPRRTPVVVTSHDGWDYIVSLAGESQWVRNVRAAEGRAVIRRVRSRDVRLEELPPSARAEVIAAYLQAAENRGGAKAAAGQARSYFGLPPEPTAEDIAGVAAYYPVFRIHDAH